MTRRDEHRIGRLAELDAVYGAPVEVAVLKETDRVIPVYRTLIEAAPFVALATTGPEGLDCSPRGDAPGFVQVVDEHTLMMPVRRGNNRVDSLRNIVRDPRVGLLFLIPGIGETLRVNGRAHLSTDPELVAGFAVEGQAPRCVIVVAVEAVYVQCSRALMRADLWNPERHVPRATLPSMGTILQAATNAHVEAKTYDAALDARVRATLA